MTERRKFQGLIITGFLLMASPGYTHHSFGAFDMRADAEILLPGVVKEWRLVNPHSSLTVTVLNISGEAIDWALESAQVPQLIARGITRDTYRPGDAITAMVGPLKNGQPGGIVKWVKHADGSFTLPVPMGTNTGQEALDRWLSENSEEAGNAIP